jgi:ADP-heptose:LPS heptosyltransferase
VTAGAAAPVRSRILVIKLGALGDFVQAMGPARAIRAHHPEAEITLLTAPAYAELAAKAPYFDRIWVDERPGLGAILALWRLRRRLRSGFTRVYDLQTSDRSGFYFRLMGPGIRPEWSGIARGASHPHRNPARNRMHTIERQADQLRYAGITATPPPDLAWAASDITRFGLAPGFVLLVPGGAAHRPAKRWPVARYAELARWIAGLGVQPLVLGGPDERPLGAFIAAHCPAARDLTGATGLGDIVSLARQARHAVGNDTGPMHLIAAAGAPATVLFSRDSDPDLTAPRGAAVSILRRDDLATLPLEEVAATLRFG